MDQKTFQLELTLLGGLNDRGGPVLKVVRCDQEITFAFGRTIPKYFVPGGAKAIREKYFRKRHIFTGEISECTREEAKEIYDRCANADITNHYLAETMDVKRNDPVPREGYFIEQYIPPARIKDTPEQWEHNRFGMWFDDALEKEVWVDKSGPFPFEGRYEGFIHTNELTQDVMIVVRKAWATRDTWRQTKSAELMARDVFREAELREARAEEEALDIAKNHLAGHAFDGVYLSGGKPNDKADKEFFK